MAQTMKAFVMKRIGEVGILEKPIPEPGPNDAILRTTAALIWTAGALFANVVSALASATGSFAV